MGEAAESAEEQEEEDVEDLLQVPKQVPEDDDLLNLCDTPVSPKGAWDPFGASTPHLAPKREEDDLLAFGAVAAPQSPKSPNSQQQFMQPQQQFMQQQQQFMQQQQQFMQQQYMQQQQQQQFMQQQYMQQQQQQQPMPGHTPMTGKIRALPKATAVEPEEKKSSFASLYVH